MIIPSISVLTTDDGTEVDVSKYLTPQNPDSQIFATTVMGDNIEYSLINPEDYWSVECACSLLNDDCQLCENEDEDEMMEEPSDIQQGGVGDESHKVCNCQYY